MSSVLKSSKTQWKVRPAGSGVKEFARKLGSSSILAQVLLNRGIGTVEQARVFLSPKLTDLIEPERMPGVEAAVVRIRRAIERSEPIVVYGDYDVDGITGVAILWHLLTMLGGKVDYYIPHRIDEGYGVNAEAIRQIAETGAKLLVTVDCGITAVEETVLAGQLGMEMIVTDHHQPHERLPAAAAIVHPRTDPAYPNPDSAGAMVAFKLAWAVVNSFKNGRRADEPLRNFLLNATTLAAMGTVADVVDLRGENRILTHYGLKALPQSRQPGIRALIESAELDAGTLDSYDIAFRLAPMLNAAGRMGHARLAVELLTCDNELRCMQIARYLKDQNRRRQQCQREIFQQARERIGAMGLDHPDRRTIVLADEGWHTGVIGIVASRILEEYNRPAILINSGNGTGTAQGSGRSIDGFDIHQALSACSQHLLSFGGHSKAAGLRLSPDKIADFAAAFEEHARTCLSEHRAVATIEIDAEYPIDQFGSDTVKELARLEPFGQGNPKPVFATRGVRWIAPPRKVGQRGDHLQLAVTDHTASVRCIGFDMGRLEKKLLESDCFSVAYEVQLDSFRGSDAIQFVLKEIQFE
jgi:single-stranded-DNA-specific exonuclease